uniref:Retrovirus-related Pol polyprotein from transposon TNT 1-94 n=1 Tax=Cajanus cajan TaxID=3821 RepID=A0A151TKI9_CAJCA|nr:Retrovirus-related Pol polyprotein from transposon TNT 1-94 [Cajanus cajan]
MSKDMLTRVIGCKTSFQLWDKIHSYFHSHMNAKARQLRIELRNTNLENQTISDYVLRIQTLVDALTAIGDSISVKEHLDIILEGLPEEYESTVSLSLISSRFDLLSIEEVETLLLGHESRLEKFKKKAVASRLQSGPSSSVYTAPFELIIFSDLWGPASVTSTCGFQYYITFVDAYTRFTWIYLLKNKAQTIGIFKQFHNMVKNQFQLPIKALQTDWGGKYRPFTAYLNDVGIQHRLICPHTHHQNGVVERKHRHIVELGLTMLAEANLPMQFWDYAFPTSVYLINRLPSSSIQNEVPYQKLFNKIPDYHFLKVFGCSCFPHLRPYNRNKLQLRSQECLFLGYSTSHKG